MEYFFAFLRRMVLEQFCIHHFIRLIVKSWTEEMGD